MTKLSEINEAFNDRNVSANEYGRLRNSWFIERGLGTETIDDTMRYIERLEDDRRHLLASVMQLLQISRAEKDYQKSIIMKAQHLLTVMHDAQQHEREEIARLKAELTKACATARAMEKIENQHAVTIMALRQEIARLREALRAFTKCIDAHQQREQSGLLRDDMWEAYEQAQAVLAANRSKG